jgi:hypothetical protein
MTEQNKMPDEIWAVRIRGTFGIDCQWCEEVDLPVDLFDNVPKDLYIKKANSVSMDAIKEILAVWYKRHTKDDVEEAIELLEALLKEGGVE